MTRNVLLGARAKLYYGNPTLDTVSPATWIQTATVSDAVRDIDVMVEGMTEEFTPRDEFNAFAVEHQLRHRVTVLLTLPWDTDQNIFTQFLVANQNRAPLGFAVLDRPAWGTPNHGIVGNMWVNLNFLQPVRSIQNYEVTLTNAGGMQWVENLDANPGP